MKKMIVSCLVATLLVACQTVASHKQAARLTNAASFEELAKNLEGCTNRFLWHALYGEDNSNANASTAFEVQFQKTEESGDDTATQKNTYTCRLLVKSTSKGIIQKIQYSNGADCQHLLYTPLHEYMQTHAPACKIF